MQVAEDLTVWKILTGIMLEEEIQYQQKGQELKKSYVGTLSSLIKIWIACSATTLQRNRKCNTQEKELKPKYPYLLGCHITLVMQYCLEHSLFKMYAILKYQLKTPFPIISVQFIYLCHRLICKLSREVCTVHVK